MITMSIFLAFIFFSLFLPALGGEDDCKPTRCSKNGPKIQFPFRDKYLRPEYCGYPGFDVFCNEKNETVLVLPSSVHVVVKKINYKSQHVDLYDPQQCLPKKLPHLNLSLSPFQFRFSAEYLYDFTLFNCSASKTELTDFLVQCFNDSSYSVFAVETSQFSGLLPLTSCTNINEFSSVPWHIFDKNDLRLKWVEPARGGCEARRKRRSLNNSTRGYPIIQCVDIPDIPNMNTQGASLVRGATLGSCLVVIILSAVVLLCISIREKKDNHMKIEKFLDDQRALKPTRFSYSDLRRITLKFSEKLGEGGYGIVYKGKLSSEINVAVKVLHNSKGNGEEFVNEVSTIGRIHHVNVVRLVGYCADEFKRALVYEFLPNDSLEKFIFQSSSSKKKSLSWQKIQDIALGIAKGIEYLHEGCDTQILHFDIKPQNILLDQNLNPKICDFGLAKLCAKEQSWVTMTAARGTMGYIAPEVLSRTFGRVSFKSDVYSFGMLLLEMVGGRKNIDSNANTSQVYFPQWIYNHMDFNLGDVFLSPIEEGGDGNVTKRLTIIGLWCIQWCPADRLSMKDVIQMLEGDEENLIIPPNPFPANINATNPVVGMTMIPRRHFEIELPLTKKPKYFNKWSVGVVIVIYIIISLFILLLLLSFFIHY